MSVIKGGDHIIFGDVIYGCTFAFFTKILPLFHVDYSIVDTTDPSAVEAAIKPNTTMVYVETPANPVLKIDVDDLIADLIQALDKI